MKQTLFSALVMVCAILVGYWWAAIVGILVIDIFAFYMIQKSKSWNESFNLLSPSLIYQIVGMSLGTALFHLVKSMQTVA